ncbi:hypothetical protein RUM43_010604 [Polyplax serrata]|uniref:Uncharacterized protein n=1 Tax=Polyplax serrata TaxID=468196 RepID=A0AAN8SA07_POLSC
MVRNSRAPAWDDGDGKPDIWLPRVQMPFNQAIATEWKRKAIESFCADEDKTVTYADDLTLHQGTFTAFPLSPVAKFQVRECSLPPVGHEKKGILNDHYEHHKEMVLHIFYSPWKETPGPG